MLLGGEIKWEFVEAKALIHSETVSISPAVRFLFPVVNEFTGVSPIQGPMWGMHASVVLRTRTHEYTRTHTLALACGESRAVC